MKDGNESIQPKYQREKLTYSVAASAYAIATGVRLIRTYKEPSGKSTIVLADEYDQASDAIRTFFDGEPLINARTYMDCRRYLLDEMNNPTTSSHKENENAANSTTN